MRVMTIAVVIRIVTIIAAMRIIVAMVGAVTMGSNPTAIGMIVAARAQRAL
jgi:hypothetical protein